MGIRSWMDDSGWNWLIGQLFHGSFQVLSGTGRAVRWAGFLHGTQLSIVNTTV